MKNDLKGQPLPRTVRARLIPELVGTHTEQLAKMPPWKWRENKHSIQIKVPGQKHWSITLSYGDTPTNKPLFGTREEAIHNAKGICELMNGRD